MVPPSIILVVTPSNLGREVGRAPEEIAMDLLENVTGAITRDLMVEDDLNREVDDILRAHQSELQQESVDYRRMFQLIKHKLAKERGLIL